MILAAGMSPAWQQILVLDAFRCGEVNRAREVHWCTSGKVCNVGIALGHLGGPCRLLSTAGGPAVPLMERELDGLGVPYRWVRTRSETRICTTILDQATGTITELVENGRPIEPQEREQFRTAYAEDAARAEVVVLIGSLPAGTPQSFYRELVQRTPCPMVLDFRGEGLVGVLDLKPYVVKPNREELARTVGRPLETDESLLGAMRELNRGGAAWAVVTQGAGPVFVTSPSEAWRLYPPPVRPLVNPIGSGDALAATIAWATRAGRPLLDAVRLGVAAAGQNVRQLLPCRLNAKSLEDEAAAVRVERCGG